MGKKNENIQELRKFKQIYLKNNINLKNDLFKDPDIFDDKDLIFASELKNNFKLSYRPNSIEKGLHLNWEQLKSSISDYDKIINNLAVDLSDIDTKLKVINTFKIGTITFKKNTFFDSNSISFLVDFIEKHMFVMSGIPNENAILLKIQRKVNMLGKETDTILAYYKHLEKRHLVRKHMVEEYVNKLIGYNLNHELFLIVTHEIVRLIKQVYNQTLSAVNHDKTVIPQAYLLTGHQGTGKSMLIEGLFHNFWKPIQNANDPQKGMKTTSNQVVFFEEISNMGKTTDDIKDYITNENANQNVKYVAKDVDFYNRAVKVAASNKKDILTDRTSNGDNRRWIVIPFPEQINTQLFAQKIKEFFKNNNCKKLANGRYDTSEYFDIMTYNVLFTSEYDDISVDLTDNKDDYSKNKSLIRLAQSKTDLDIELDDLLNKYVKVNSSIIKDKPTDIIKSLLKSEDLMTQIENGKHNTNNKIIQLKNEDKIYVSIIKKYLKEIKFNYTIKGLISAMSLQGYHMDHYRNRQCFIKNK